MAISQTIFRQYDIRGIVGQDLTIEVAYGLGRGYAALLAQRGIQGAVAVGRDNRPTGDALRDALVRGLTECGVDVVDVGVVPTPLLYWSLHHEPVVGGIQITGSHNPPEYNGFKMCLGTASLHGADIQTLYQLIIGGQFPSGSGQVRHVEVIDRYVADIVARIGPLTHADGTPIKVVYDCGNGAGALVAPQLMEALGVQGIGLFTESDGSFPNHHPDPTVPENLEDCIAAVASSGAELGVAFDGDADRIGVVDRNGRIIWGDHILILYARDVLARTGAGQPIIFDVKCSQALTDGISQAGGTPVMWKTGHSLIKDKMKEMHAPIAGEMSGHMFFTEGFYGHDDALYAAARLLRIVADSGKRVDELLADVPHFVSTPEIRIDTDDDTKFAIMAKAVPHFTASYDVIDVDGVRVLFGDGWGLLRASNTQPVIVARYEARSEERLAEIRGVMEGWLREQGVTL
ncbi:phosphomannomutase [Gemmatimonas aurantiaca T-27]|uniref:Phosphomannomutase n=1 Tax=Gemmatimonas aurantiaca (strain DSM 14586 / JCM 11422 / NBRC 100505 / T-27) TaxID=379066 RepID=C1A8Y0_GEMAT|nr:phosphomannomutase/phosphoglucomutase [Gemmatimonas aurantiaca]BAH38690.1 phosphomannomutase [Gemmatimonas aurantiaca T-27]